MHMQLVIDNMSAYSCGMCAQLANVLSTEALFYACILPFIAFFGAFAFIMYPLRDVLHPTGKLTMGVIEQHSTCSVCALSMLRLGQ